MRLAQTLALVCTELRDKMTPTNIPIANLVLANSTTNTVTFSNLSSIYADYIIVANAGSTTGSGTIFMRINGNTGGSYLNYGWGAYGSSTGITQRDTTSFDIGFGATNNSIIANFVNARIAGSQKSIVWKSTGSQTTSSASHTLWGAAEFNDTSAVISTITITRSSGFFSSGSHFTLYGLVA